MNYQELYESKRTTLGGALHMLRSGDAVAVSGELCEPSEFLNHLDRVIGELEDVTLFKVKKGDGSGENQSGNGGCNEKKDSDNAAHDGQRGNDRLTNRCRQFATACVKW